MVRVFESRAADTPQLCLTAFANYRMVILLQQAVCLLNDYKISRKEINEEYNAEREINSYNAEQVKEASLSEN